MKMKHILIFVGLFLGLSLSAQDHLQLDRDVARYYAQDSTTFFLEGAKDKKSFMVDFTTVDQDDIEFRIGMAYKEKDGTFRSAGDLDFTAQGSASAIDSVILNRTTYAKTIKSSAGTRYTTSRIYIELADGFPAPVVALTFFWGTAESGRVKVYF